MAEPTTLYRDGDEVIVIAPSEVRRMLADGWSLTDDYVPFAFNDNILDFGSIVIDKDALPVTIDVAPVKRGRPRKAQM